MAMLNHIYADDVEQLQIASVKNGSETDWINTDGLADELKEVISLYNVAVGVGSSLNPDEVVWRLYKESSRLIDTTNFAVVIYDNESDMLDFVLVFDHGQRLKPRSVKRSESQGLVADVLTSETPLLIPDLSKTNHTVGNDKIASWLGVPILNPLLTQEGPQGVIATWSYKPNGFDDHSLWLLSAVGTQAAIAVRNARTYEASQQRVAELARLKDLAQRRMTELAMLNDITRTLSETLQFDEVLTRIMERVEGILKAEAGWLLLADPETGDLVFQIGLGRTRATAPFRLPRGEGLAGEVARSRKSVLVKLEHDGCSYQELEGTIDFSVCGILCVPLILDDQVIGVLEVMSKKGDDFTQGDLELLDAIVPYAVIAIRNSRFHESVLAERDRVIEAEEKARRALARDLHDGATQLVSAMMMRLDFCKMLVNRDPVRLAQEIAETQELATHAIHQIRTLLFELRPLALEAQGLVAALQVFMERRQKDILEGNAKLTLNTSSFNSNGEISRQDEKVERAVFAIVQEAVNNAIRHARASHIVVEVKETYTAINTVITDDGDGFEVDEVMTNYASRGSLGMVNSKERAELIGSELLVESSPGKGTQVSIQVPKAKEERMKNRGATGRLSLLLNVIPKI
jgi:signal transduction histidine kinase